MTEITVTAAEFWELQKRAADVENAKLKVALAEQALAACQAGILQRRNLPPGDYHVVQEPPA